jgi:arsenate reductase
MTREGPMRVLFVCTHNSARSIMAEAVLRHEGGDRFEVFSAGTEVTRVNPLTLRALAEAGIDAAGARSKSVSEFRGEPLDYVVTVCDQARESCPVFHGADHTLHWSFDDPSAATGTDEERMVTFRSVLAEVTASVKAFAVMARERSEENAAVTG